MITNEITITYNEQYLISREISPETSIFFDIETTGFKAGYSHLYLIGVGFRTETAWTIRQWMAERPQEETSLLRTFAQFLSNYTTILHFNGKRFDIPYLEEKYEQYGLVSPFTDMCSIDLYQDFKPLKTFLKLERMNQKSLELFLGLERDDQYDGGKLIPVYRDFCKTSCDEKLRLLLLHNQEDVSGMFTLSTLYGYLNVFQLGCSEVSSADPYLQNLSVEFLENRDGTKNLLFGFSLKLPVPVPVSFSTETGYLTLNKCTGKLMIPVLEDTLYFFFEDYKNYYYLPQEDQAIHKSVAAYVEKQYRQPAKKENCYTKHQGLFLPQTKNFQAPSFHRCYKDPISWMLWKEEEWTDAANWSTYLCDLIQTCFLIQ